MGGTLLGPGFVCTIISSGTLAPVGFHIYTQNRLLLAPPPLPVLDLYSYFTRLVFKNLILLQENRVLITGSFSVKILVPDLLQVLAHVEVVGRLGAAVAFLVGGFENLGVG